MQTVATGLENIAGLRLIVCLSRTADTGEMMNYSFYTAGAGRDFVVFNDGELSMETVTAGDLERIEIAKGNPLASAAWSSGCDWYFVVTTEGIALLNVHSNRGFLCKKKSAVFIEMFLNAPHRMRRKKAA